MRSSNYITKVISHITNKQQKKLVEYELTDHIIEKHNFYEDIGYDDDASLEKADKIMGDADIVGEQFEALNKARNIRKIIAATVSFLLFVAACAYISINSDTESQLYNYAFSFYGYVVCNIIFILNLICIIYGFRKLRVNNIIFGCIACLGILGTGGKYIENSIYYLFTGKNVFLSFYGIYDSYNELHSPFQYLPFEYSESWAVLAILGILFIAVLIIGSTLIVRLGKLKNTRTDLKINLTVRIVLIILTIGLTALFGYYLYEVPSYRDEVIAQTRADLEEYDKTLIDNLDVFNSGSYDDMMTILQNEFDADIADQLPLSDEEDFSIKYKSIWRNDSSQYSCFFVDYYIDSGLNIEARALATDLDGSPLKLNTEDELKQIEELSVKTDVNPADLAYPFEFIYNTNTEKAELAAVYGKNSYSLEDIYSDPTAEYENYFTFEKEGNDLKLVNSVINQNIQQDLLKNNYAIIGGEDGPTAIFVTSKTSWWAIGIGAAAIAGIIAFIIKKKKK
ncbi:MAG: hypothetical protein ACLUFN_10270 [Eubacterium sp.]